MCAESASGNYGCSVVVLLSLGRVHCLGIQNIDEKMVTRQGKRRLCVSSAVRCCCCCKIGKYVNTKNDDNNDEVPCVDSQLY